MNIMKKIAVMAMSVLLFLGLVTIDAEAETSKSVTVEAGATAKEIQAALDENANGDYELTVNIPTGTYKLDKTLYVYANTTIKADSDAKLIKQSGYGAMIETKILNDKGGYNANSNITIDGGTWDSTPVMNNSTGTESFRFIHSNNITVINATLCNVPVGSHLIVLAGVQNATVSNCRFYGYQNWEKAKTPKEAIQLDNVHSVVQVPTSQAAEIKWDDLPCDNITIKDCEFYNYSRGIGSHTAVAGKLHKNVTISNNNFHELSDSAIRLYNYADTIVSGNTINNVVEGILAYTYMAEADSYFKPLDGKIAVLPEDYNITIKNNTIKNVKDASNTWGDGIRVMGKANSKGRELAGVDIIGNTISSTSRYGIFATVAPNLIISGTNKITATSSNGILLESGCDNSSIQKASISSVIGSGIAVYASSDVRILNNTVSSKADAIYLLDATSCFVGKSTETGNIVTSSAGNGISLSIHPGNGRTGCTSTQVAGNTVKSAKQNGINAYNSKKIKVDGNTITKAGKDGINLNGGCTSSTVTGNTITSAGKTGIAISSSKSVAVNKNAIKKYGRKANDAAGIYIFQSGGTSTKMVSKVENNTITGTGSGTTKYGIRVSTSNYTTITSNKLNNIPGTAVYIYLTKNCTVEKCTVSKPKKMGIYFTTSCNNGKIVSNTITGVKKADAIKIYSSTGCTNSKNVIKK